MLLLLTLNIFYTLFYCYNCWVRTSKFELCLRNYSFRQWICFQWLWKIFIAWARTVCCATNFHNYSPNMKLRKDNSVTKIFMTELQKDKLNSDFVQLESCHCNVSNKREYFFFLSKLITVYVLTNRAIIYYNIYIHIYIYLYS